jgi:hypothetical protein
MSSISILLIGLGIGLTIWAYSPKRLPPRRGDTNSDKYVIVSDDAYLSDDPFDIKRSNFDYVNALVGEGLEYSEIVPDAMRSYWVDVYLGNFMNGGFEQFVFNTRWDPIVVRSVREGLAAMRAKRHLDVFNEGATIVESWGPEGLESFFQDAFKRGDKQTLAFGPISKKFFPLQERKDLTVLNANWLRRLPNLQVRTPGEMRAEIKRRVAAIPDLEARRLKALQDQPRYMKLMRALTLKAGHKLEKVTIRILTPHQSDKRVLAWNFLTDHGHFYMFEENGKAMMCSTLTRLVVAEVEIKDEA